LEKQMQTMTPYIEIVAIERDDATPDSVVVRLSAAPTPEWRNFFGQAWILATVERRIPADFGWGAHVEGDRIVIPNASPEAVALQIDGLRHIVQETNRITAGYYELVRRSHGAC
jgi:hypothetical protein